MQTGILLVENGDPTNKRTWLNCCTTLIAHRTFALCCRRRFGGFMTSHKVPMSRGVPLREGRQSSFHPPSPGTGVRRDHTKRNHEQSSLRVPGLPVSRPDSRSEPQTWCAPYMNAYLQHEHMYVHSHTPTTQKELS